MAWIQCRLGQDGLFADPRPNCTRPGRSTNTVYSLAPGQERVLLDRGSGIEPRSLDSSAPD
jgi:hypothetical protein